jgi:hypothetical protein
MSPAAAEEIVMKGGHAASGPAPDPKALARERDAGDWTVLPAEGRAGPAPEWPLTEASERELWWWRRLWAKPQAVMWEKQGQVDEVALYARRLAQVEAPDAPVNLGTLVRQLADALGITLPGMLRLRWHLAAPGSAPAAASEGETPRRGPAGPTSRGRLTVVRGEDAGG